MNTTLFELADQLKAAKDRKKQLDADTKANNAQIEELFTLLPQQPSLHLAQGRHEG